MQAYNHIANVVTRRQVRQNWFCGPSCGPCTEVFMGFFMASWASPKLDFWAPKRSQISDTSCGIVCWVLGIPHMVPAFLLKSIETSVPGFEFWFLTLKPRCKQTRKQKPNKKTIYAYVYVYVYVYAHRLKARLRAPQTPGLQIQDVLTGYSNSPDCWHGIAKLLDGFTTNIILLGDTVGINHNDRNHLFKKEIKDERDKRKLCKELLIWLISLGGGGRITTISALEKSTKTAWLIEKALRKCIRADIRWILVIVKFYKISATRLERYDIVSFKKFCTRKIHCKFVQFRVRVKIRDSHIKLDLGKVTFLNIHTAS